MLGDQMVFLKRQFPSNSRLLAENQTLLVPNTQDF
ncbi:MAG: hypothetical protein ACI9YG_002363 [Candidatus Azotimanducaceae bacterium]